MSSFVPQSLGARDAKSAVEDSISGIIGSCTVERRANQGATGFIRSHPSALSTRDTTWCVPDIVPIGGISWPEPLLALWKTMNYSSLVGLFPALSRVWLVADNKLILWDYREGREFCLYDEIPELIIAVGTPVKPREGVFQPHVTYILPVATSTMVFLLGLCIVNEEAMSEIKVVSLGYSASTDTLITKITGHTQQGRIFCAGSDGNTYEVRYLRENTPFVPKMRMVCFSYLFASVPILGQISGLVNTAKQTWTGPKAGLCDICVDERREIVFALDEKSVITLWHMTKDGLTYVHSLPHRPTSSYVRSGSSGQETLSPLSRLFVVDPDPEGCTLVAIALNGDQFRYRYLSAIAGDSQINLCLRGYVASYLPSSQATGVCFASGSTVMISCCGQSDAMPDELVAATSPKAIMEPFSKYRDVVSSLSAAATGIVRVEAIDAVYTSPRRSPNDLCAQTCHPPTLLMVAHRHGLSAYLQMRPVDTLYTIVNTADAQVRESMLQRFAAVFNVVDYMTMLLQIAVGGLHVVGVNKWNLPSGLVSQVSPADVSMLTVDHIGRKLLEGNSSDARRIANELLRTASLPTTQASASFDSREVVIVMSPMSSAVVTYLSRALYGVWDTSIRRLQREDFAAIDKALVLLVQFLEGMDVPSQSEESLRVSVPHQWQQNKVVVSLPPGGSLSLSDVNKLQMTMMLHCYKVACKAKQTVSLLRHLSVMPIRSEDKLTTFAQIVRDQATAHGLGQYISGIVLASQHGVGATERREVFSRLLKQCPYFFSSTDVQGFQARADIDAMVGGDNFGSYSESQMARWIATVAPKAASYWSSGALQSICEQLNSLKKSDVSVKLLLHAASQLDPTNSAFAIYLAEHNGVASQVEGNNTALYAVYQSKSRVLSLVTSIIETAWYAHRSMVNDLLGGPRCSGSIWAIEPNDEMAHCYLFDWLRAPRDDPIITQALRDTLVTAKSPFLEKYLASNASVLGAEYAHYLRHVQGNHKGAIEQCVLQAQSQLAHIHSSERLRYRIKCLTEALECARACDSDQIHQVEQRLHLLEAQQRLYGVVAQYIGSGMPELDNRVQFEGRSVTERELSLDHMEVLSSYVVAASNLLQTAGMYSSFGGAEVQLDVLASSNVNDAAMLAACVYRAYDLRGGDVVAISRRLIGRYCKPAVSFPITSIIRVLEGYHFKKQPQGSEATIRILTECNVDLKMMFYAYQDILEGKDPIAHIPCSIFSGAGVTMGYLIHSLCIVVVQMSQAVQRGTLQQTFVSQAMRVVRDYVIQSAADRAVEPVEREAFARAEGLLRQAESYRVGRY